MSTSTQIALVIGMHRSGTSALAGLVSELGFDVGEKLLPTNEFNEKGYYENEAIVNFHSRAFEELRSCWHDLRILPDDAFRGGWLDDKVVQLSSVLQTQFGSSRRIVVKDPRATRLLPIWKRFASETGVGLNYLIIGRHPLEVSYSLGHRDGFSRQKSLLLWLQYNLLAERYTRSNQRLILTYQDLIANPEAKGREIAAFLGIEQGASIGKAAATIEPSIVHHTATNETWCEQPDVRRWTNDTWQSLFQDKIPAAKHLDVIYQELAQRLEILPDEATGLGDYRAAATERELLRKEKTYESLQEKYRDQNRSLEKVMRERDEIRAQAAAKYQEREETLRKVMLERDVANRERAQSEGERLKLEDHLQKLQTQSSLSVKQKAMLEAELARAGKQMVAKQSKLDRLQQELEKLRHKWIALPMRRRLKKLANGYTSRKLTNLNAVTPGVWNESNSGFHFAATILPNVSHPGEFFIAGWVIGGDESDPQVRIVNDSARYQAKRRKKRVDVPLLFPQDKRAAESGFVVSGIKDGSQNNYRLEIRRSSAEWVAVANIDLSAVGRHHFRRHIRNRKLRTIRLFLVCEALWFKRAKPGSINK